MAKRMNTELKIGTAGWSLPKDIRAFAAPGNSILERYASCYNCVEINSCFYRPHRPATFSRWADSVPDDFSFSLKLSKAITHQKKLINVEDDLASFVEAASGLQEKWGCMLIQIPPSLDFQLDIAKDFFRTLRDLYEGKVAFEPRHVSWGTEPASQLLKIFNIARVVADPLRVFADHSRDPFIYYRWHGSPEMYRSAYTDKALDDLAADIKKKKAAGLDVWCIFDNTMFQHASFDALKLAQRLVSDERTKRGLLRAPMNEI